MKQLRVRLPALLLLLLLYFAAGTLERLPASGPEGVLPDGTITFSLLTTLHQTRYGYNIAMMRHEILFEDLPEQSGTQG